MMALASVLMARRVAFLWVLAVNRSLAPQASDQPSRAEAIRRLVEQALSGRGTGSPSRKQKSKA
jgi:hypothetical protein